MSCLPAAFVSCLVLATADAKPPPQAEDLPVDIEADSSVFDFRNNTFLFRNFRITRGDTSLQADEAVSTDQNFENGSGTFSGHVIITTANGKLRAEKADVDFRDNRLFKATIHGSPDSAAGNSPATFEQKLENPEALARGQASTIEYDVAAGTVRLKGDARINYNDNDMRAETLVYSIKEEKILANPEDQGKQRVRYTINPRSLKHEKDKKPPQ